MSPNISPLQPNKIVARPPTNERLATKHLLNSCLVFCSIKMSVVENFRTGNTCNVPEIKLVRVLSKRKEVVNGENFGDKTKIPIKTEIICTPSLSSGQKLHTVRVIVVDNLL